MPPTVTLRRFADDEFPPWRERQVATFAAVLSQAEARPAVEFLQPSVELFDRLLPDGLATEGHQVCHLLDEDGQNVGDAGFNALALNVFGYNKPARRLYDTLGYQVISTQLSKSLEESG